MKLLGNDQKIIKLVDKNMKYMFKKFDDLHNQVSNKMVIILIEWVNNIDFILLDLLYV